MSMTKEEVEAAIVKLDDKIDDARTKHQGAALDLVIAEINADIDLLRQDCPEASRVIRGQFRR
jgi:hypothetical protein